MGTPLDNATDAVLGVLLNGLGSSQENETRRFFARSLALAALEMVLVDLSDAEPFARVMAEGVVSGKKVDGSWTRDDWVQCSQSIRESVVGDERFDPTNPVQEMALGLMTEDIFRCAVDAATEDSSVLDVAGIGGREVAEVMRMQPFVHPLTGDTRWEAARIVYGF